MKRVQIALAKTSAANARVFGEVKAVDIAGSPTVAHVEASANMADAFNAEPGRYSFHFRVSEKCTLTLTTEADGVVVGPRIDFDATQITAGRRYHFVVPA